jgi:hypothetical protein
MKQSPNTQAARSDSTKPAARQLEKPTPHVCGAGQGCHSAGGTGQGRGLPSPNTVTTEPRILGNTQLAGALSQSLDAMERAHWKACGALHTLLELCTDDMGMPARSAKIVEAGIHCLAADAIQELADAFGGHEQIVHCAVYCLEGAGSRRGVELEGEV